jgi:hypothetical protein
VQSPRPHSGPVWETITKLFPDLEEHPEWCNAQQKDDDTKEFLGLQESLSFLEQFPLGAPSIWCNRWTFSGRDDGFYSQSFSRERASQNLHFHSPPEKQWKAILCMNAPNSYDTEIHFANDDKQLSVVESTPSLHVFGGESDFTSEGQQKMQTTHHPNNFHIIRHDKGHFFPNDDQEKLHEITRALDKMVPTEWDEEVQ